MNYQVWTKDEYEGWGKVDCGDKEAAMREIDKALRLGKEPLLTVEIPYKVSIKLEEDKIGEATKGKAKSGKGPGGEGDSEVRRGDEGGTKKLDKGSGNSSAGNSAGD